ncbi:MAG: EthD domain-containing protein [Myxococcota bacterium]
MIRTLSLIKRRPDLSREAFRDHYETVHAPLALPYMDGLVRYVRYHLDAELLGEVRFDVLSAFWYRDAESTARLMAILASDEGKPILEDELTFMDKPANVFFPVSERRLEDGEEGDVHEWVLIRKPEGLDRSDASKVFVRDHLPSLLGAAGGLRFALLRDAFPVEGGVLPYNAVVQVGSDGIADLEAWAARLEGEGWTVAAVRTRRHETALGDAAAPPGD